MISKIYADWQKSPRPLDQTTHAAINAMHYPGTRQMCVVCDTPTGSCEEDSRFVGDVGPLCESCAKAIEEKQSVEKQ